MASYDIGAWEARRVANAPTYLIHVPSAGTVTISFDFAPDATIPPTTPVVTSYVLTEAGAIINTEAAARLMQG